MSRWVRDRRAPLMLVTVLLAYRAVVVVLVGHLQTSTADVDRFYQIATAPGVPYRDFSLEYPPLTVALLKVMGLLSPGRAAFGAIVVISGLAAELIAAEMLRRGWGVNAALALLVLDAPLYLLLLTRLDFVVMALAVAAALAWRHRRARTAGVLVVAAMATKLWPLAIGLFLLVAFRGRQRVRFATAAAASGVVVLAVWSGLGGLDGFVQVVSFRGAHGWQIESAIGSMVRVFTHEAATLQEGAHRFGSVPPGLEAALIVLALAVTVWAAWRGGSRGDIAGTWIVAVGALLLVSTLLSPQFIIWIVPAGAIVWAQGDHRIPLLVAGVVILTALETFLYGSLVRLHVRAEVVVIVRNGCLLALVVAAASRLSRTDSVTVRSPEVLPA